MCDDVLAMKQTCAGGDQCRCATSHEKTHKGNIEGSITDILPNIR